MTEHEPKEPLFGYFTDVGDSGYDHPKWVIKDTLPVGITFIVGPPKRAKKSSMLLAMALSVAGHKNKVLPRSMAFVTAPGIVMGLSAEASVGRIKYTFKYGMGVDVPNDGSIYIADDPWKWRLDDPEAVPQLMFWLNEYKPKLFFLDPLRDFHMQEEKDDGAMNRLLRPIQQWAIKNESAFVVVHHSRKRADKNVNYDHEDIRGSSSILGIADGVYIITPLNGGKLHVAATFKCGEDWERDIKLGMWGEDVQADGEALDDVAIQVFKAFTLGATDLGVIARQLTKAKASIVEACKVLTSVGCLEKLGKSYTITKDGRTIFKELVPK